MKNISLRIPKSKLYHLTGPDGQIYSSYEKGALGGYKGGGNKNVYGRLDCPCALRALAASTHASYESKRVFFKNEDDAISAGFRPCHCCLPEKYAKWKAGEDPRTAPFPQSD